MRGVPTGMKWNAVEWWNTAVHAPAFLLSSPLLVPFFSFSFSFFLPFSCSSSLPSTGRQSRAEPPFRGRFSPLSTAFPPVVFLSLLTCGTSRNLSIIIVLRASARGLSLCLLSPFLPFLLSSTSRCLFRPNSLGSSSWISWKYCFWIG